MSQGVDRFVQERALNNWYQVDKELGSRIASGLGLTLALSAQGQDGQTK